MFDAEYCNHGVQMCVACIDEEQKENIRRIAAEPKWLDAPDRDGIWARSWEGEYKECARVVDGLFLLQPPGRWSASKWWYVGPIPPDPAPPLPKTREVTMVASVERTASGSMWRGFVGVPGLFDEPKAIINESREKCIEWCRAFGVEPEVQDA